MSFKSMPADKVVKVIPAILGAGGSPLSFNTVFISQDEKIPVGEVLPFASANSVSKYFGETSPEYKAAVIYFKGFEGSHIKPGTVFFYKHNKTDVGAFLRSASVADMTLNQLKAISGDLTVTIDGTNVNATALNFSAVTSFSDAATVLSTALSVTVKFDTLLQSFVICSGSTGLSSTIDYASGSVAQALKLTQNTGAVMSRGAVADTPSSLMNDVVKSSQNWVSFTYIDEPDTDTKIAFAEWANGSDNRYLFIAWDTDPTAEIFGNTTNFGSICKARAFDGVAPLYSGLEKAAFLAGTIASIDWAQQNGRITLKFKRQAGLVADVTDETIAYNLTSNGYNYYGAWATANDRFLFFAEGSMPGQWMWIDTYVNQIRLNSQLQLALITLLTQSKSIPYNSEGIALQRAACDDPLNEALNFGSIRPGVELSEQQQALINSEAGTDAATQIEQMGYYLMIKQASAQARGQRASMPMTLWYADGGSVHNINLGSVAVQ